MPCCCRRQACGAMGKTMLYFVRCHLQTGTGRRCLRYGECSPNIPSLRYGRGSLPLSLQTFRTYVQPSREVVMVAFVPVSLDSFIKKARCTYVLTPLRKPSQSVCAFGLTSWGFMVNGLTVELTATSLGRDPLPRKKEDRKAPQGASLGGFPCLRMA